MKQLVLIVLFAALPAVSAGAAEEMKTVAPDSYKAASAVAADGGTPVDIALAVAGPFEGRTQSIVQKNEGGERPSAATVTVERDGYLDDAVRGERWRIVLERAGDGNWKIRTVKNAWRCYRGANTEAFGTELCP